MDEEIERSEENAESEDTSRSVSSDLIRGHINTIILRALYEEDKYGYEIIADIESKSHGQYSLKQPSLYSALKRLEKDGCVTSYWGGSVSIRLRSSDISTEVVPTSTGRPSPTRRSISSITAAYFSRFVL